MTTVALSRSTSRTQPFAEGPLYDRVLEHLHGGGEVHIATAWRITVLKAKHATMISRPRADRDHGILVQFGKRRDYCLPETIHFLPGKGRR